MRNPGKKSGPCDRIKSAACSGDEIWIVKSWLTERGELKIVRWALCECAVIQTRVCCCWLCRGANTFVRYTIHLYELLWAHITKHLVNALAIV